MAALPKIVLFLGLDDIINDNFEHYLHDGFFNLKNEFHFVHILDHDNKGSFPPSVNTDDDSAVEKFINDKFDGVAAKLWGDSAEKPKVEKSIIYHQEAKLRALNYLKEKNADSCVVVTRGEQGVEGVFKNSFAYYLVANAPCDVLVLRPNKN